MSNAALLYHFLQLSRKSFLREKSDAEHRGEDTEKTCSPGPGSKGLDAGFVSAGAGKARISGAGTQRSFA